MTALVVFDIEAVPDLEAARRLLGQPDHTPDADIRGCWESVTRAMERIPRQRSSRFQSTGSSPSPPSMPNERMAAVLGR